MTIKKAYYYLFYKFYKLFNSFQQTRWLADFKAGLIVFSMEIFLLCSLKVYYFDFFDRTDEFRPLSLQTIIPFLIFFLINFFAFFRNDRWKVYVEAFELWPKEQNLKGTWIVAGLVVLIVINLIFSFYLMSRIMGVS